MINAEKLLSQKLVNLELLTSGGAIQMAVFSDREAGEDGQERRDPHLFGPDYTL